MKSVLKAVVYVASGILLFSAGVLASANRGWLQPLATIHIENRSGQQLRLLEVKHESRGIASLTTLPALPNGESARFRFYVAGEGGYRVHAVLADGTVLKDGEGYVESGYETTEIISPTAIVDASSYASGVR